MSCVTGLHVTSGTKFVTLYHCELYIHCTTWMLFSSSFTAPTNDYYQIGYLIRGCQKSESINMIVCVGRPAFTSISIGYWNWILGKVVIQQYQLIPCYCYYYLGSEDYSESNVLFCSFVCIILPLINNCSIAFVHGH